MADEKQVKEDVASADGDPDRYYLIVVGDSSEEAPKLIECDNLEAFTAAVNDHVLGAKNPIHVFGFVGARVSISAPAPVCAVEVAGQRTQIGTEDRSFDQTGRIVPLRRSED